MAFVIAETICVRRPVVLVVEDEPALQSSLCGVLEAAGFTTLRAGTVEDALVLFGRQQIDAVTLDVRLPDPKALDRSGLSLLAYLRSTSDFDRLPVIVLTGSPLDETEVELICRHHAHLFYKPQPYAILISQLRARARGARGLPSTSISEDRRRSWCSLRASAHPRRLKTQSSPSSRRSAAFRACR